MQFSQLDTPCDTLKVVYLLEVCLKTVDAWHQLLDKVVACLQNGSVADGIEQALFEQPFPKCGRGFVNQIKQGDLGRITADD